MLIRRLVRYWDWLLLLTVAISCFWLNAQAEQQFDMVTRYKASWVFLVSFFVPLIVTIYFTWKYRLFDRSRSKFIASLPVLFFMVAIPFLYDALPRFVLLATVSSPASPPALQELDVDYVNRHYAKTTYLGSNVGIRYGGEVLRFKSSRTNYFLLATERCIRAEIGQAAPGFYYIRSLQRRPGAQSRARSDYWRFFWQSGEGPFLVVGLSIMLVCWLLVWGSRQQAKRQSVQRPQTWHEQR